MCVNQFFLKSSTMGLVHVSAALHTVPYVAACKHLHHEVAYGLTV